MRQFPKLGIKEFKVFEKLHSPPKIQDFLNALPINFERKGDTCRSPLMTLRHREAHCLEGALLAAAALWYQGERPLLLDLKTTKQDDYHVVALFRRGNRWGAVSKTNHAVLRYRDPIYKTVRELALSYFNEYFTDDGVKTLRSCSAPFSLLREGSGWLTAKEDAWGIDQALDKAPHYDLFPRGAIRRLRPADPIEIKIGKVTEWRRPSRSGRRPRRVV